MKKLNFQKLSLIMLAIGVTTFYSCKEEDKTPAPVADFTATVDGKNVTVVNNSTDADTYAWDFGDGGTSDQMEPTYTYNANGSYIIKLTVTNKTGEDTKSEAVEIINITIDGDASDWADVPTIAKYADGEGGSILEVKAENLQSDKLFIYLKTTDASNGFIDFYINADNDSTTGFASWLYPKSKGIDVLLEAFIITQSAIEQDPFLGSYDNVTAGDDHTAWAWTQLTPSSDFLATEPMPSGTTKEIEFSIALSELPNGVLSGNDISFFITDVDAPDGGATDWSWLGNAPADYGNATSTAFSYTLKQ